MNLLRRGMPRDPVDVALSDIGRQGAFMAGIAHKCATVLLICFSAATFVALGNDAYAAISAQWALTHSLNIPSTISLAVITLMVLAFDVGMVYAASMLRLLATRRAEWAERWVHMVVMIGVAAIEAATYVYMAWRFERPGTGIAWALIILRAAAAPLLAVYLSMARALPVTARDIMAQVELVTGAGVIRDALRIANDPTAPLARKMELYRHSAVMAPDDGSRLDGMIAILDSTPPAIAAPDTVIVDEYAPPDPPDTPLHLVPAQARPKLTTADLYRDRKRLEVDARRRKAFDWLDAHPFATGNQLRAVLGCNRAQAGALHREWRKRLLAAQRERAQQERDTDETAS
jgi:hypothetical protein